MAEFKISAQASRRLLPNLHKLSAAMGTAWLLGTPGEQVTKAEKFAEAIKVLSEVQRRWWTIPRDPTTGDPLPNCKGTPEELEIECVEYQTMYNQYLRLIIAAMGVKCVP